MFRYRQRQRERLPADSLSLGPKQQHRGADRLDVEPLRDRDAKAQRHRDRGAASDRIGGDRRYHAAACKS